MADNINTKRRSNQYNGPVNSSDYNARIEENYEDLVYLYNKANILDVNLSKAFERVFKDQIFLSMAVKDLGDRVKSLEASENTLSIHSFNQLSPADFIGTSFAVPSSELLFYDSIYNTLTLPKVRSSSFSKLKVGSSSTGQFVPDFFKSRIQNTNSGVDAPGAVIETTPVYNCILDDPEKVWSRTIIADAPNAAGAQMVLYVQVPSNVTGSSAVNSLNLLPYPYNSVRITSIEYTADTFPSLSPNDRWLPLNSRSLYDGNTDAVGKVPPGGWAQLGSDTIVNSGPLSFIFPETDITALRITMSQRNYFKEFSKYIYTYGLADLDVRLDKYLNSGKTIIKFTAPQGELINEIVNVTPKIYNVPLSQVSSAFSHRIIYDDAGTYSLTNPGASQHVWIEVTLNKLENNTPPVLSDLIVEYL